MASNSESVRRYDILLVENDEIDILSIQRAFRKHNIHHRLTVAPNGQEAFRTLHSLAPWRPHLIVLDINMPQMTGLEFLAKLRSEPRLASVPVFILTTSDEPSDRENAYRHHVSGYIVKPMNAADFEQALLDLNRFWEINQFPETMRHPA